MPLYVLTNKKEAFEESKAELANFTMLFFPDANSRLSLAVDAPETAVEAVLQRERTGKWLPLGFFSKALDECQKKYSALDRELLAIVLGIKHFRFMLEGRAFTVYTDHKPSTTAIASNAERLFGKSLFHEQ